MGYGIILTGLQGLSTSQSTTALDDATDSNSVKDRFAGGIPTCPAARRQRVVIIATWNVRTMSGVGRAEQVVREAQRLELDVVGIMEVRWPGIGQYNVEK